MGFIQAVRDLGALDKGTGLEPYLKLPLEQGGRLIRVALNIENIHAGQLDIHGIRSVDVVQQGGSQEMKKKCLYRGRVGANASWGFSPLHRLGRPRSLEAARRDWIGSRGDWRRDSKNHLHKIRNRLLMDYEKEGFFSSGSTEKIVGDLEQRLTEILALQEVGYSYAIIFGGERQGKFIYPGEIQAFKHYFQHKLSASLKKEESKPEQPCSLCGKMSTDYATLSHVFKFATTDKVNFLPGLDREREGQAFATCRQCLEEVSAGRERVDRYLTDSRLVPGVNLWIIPEAVGESNLHAVEQAMTWLGSGHLESGESAVLGSPLAMFGNMPAEARDVVVHFVFWEKNNAQELVHLMIEDIPFHRLVFLEKAWQGALKAVMCKEYPFADLGWAIRSLHEVLARLAGANETDRLVFRDFGIKLTGTLLTGGTIPVNVFKRMVVARSGIIVQDYAAWMEMRKLLLYANIWVEFMQRVSRRHSYESILL